MTRATPSPTPGSTPDDASPAPSRRPNKRPRVLVACQRCKTRRQRCDNGSPACSNCARSSVACVYSDRTAYPPSYVKALEARVKELEEARSPTTAMDGPPTEGGDRLVTGMGLLSSCAAAEPHYFGFSAGLSLAHFVQVALDFGSVTSADVVSLPLLTDRPFANQALHQAGAAVPASLPSRKTGGAYIRAYLQLIHPLYPFLDRRQLWALHAAATKDAQSQMDPMDAALLHLVYAIGSRCLQLLGNQTSPSSASASPSRKDNTPEGHFLRAMQIIGDGLQFTSLRSIELTLLLAIHSMRSPSGTSVWHLAGLAVRQCIELGLHRQRAVRGEETAVDEHRRRLFWSVYIFERKTALVLGRPFALSDEEIDAQLPGGVSGDDDRDGAKEVRFHCAHVELYQLHTQIRLALYQLKRGGQDHRAELKATMSKLLGELDEWKAKVLHTFDPTRDTQLYTMLEDNGDTDTSAISNHDNIPSHHSPSTLTQQTELLLEFHKARRSLLQPLMTEGRPLDNDGQSAVDYAAVADASGQICQSYRRLHRLAPVPFSLRDLHAIFVAGFTLIYAICSAPALYTEAGSTCARDLGACSTLLYVITEQWASAKKYRDAFEVVAEKMEASVARYERVQGESYRSHPPVFQTVTHGPGQGMHPTLHAPLRDASTGAQAVSYGPVMTTHETPAQLDGFNIHGMSAGIELDLESDIYGIEGLLSSEGLDWFTEAVL